MSKKYGEMFQLYYKKILEYPSFSREEIEDMLKDSKSGDLDLLDKIVNNYLKVVISVVYKYESQVDENNIMAVIHCGNLALTNAIRDYEEDRNDLDKYIVNSINQAIREYFKNCKSYGSLKINELNFDGIDMNMLLLLNSKLDDKMYYVFYNILSGKTVFEIAQSMGVQEVRINEILEDAFKIYNLYYGKGELYQIAIREINKKEGKKKQRIKINPLSVDDIINFLYLQNVLTSEEARLYYYQEFSKYEYDTLELCKIMKLTRFKFIELNRTLKLKMSTYLGTKDFLAYREEMQLKYGDFLYDMLDKNKIKEVNYGEIKKLCDSLTLEEIREQLGDNIVLLNADEISLLNRFFGNVEDMYIETDKVEMDINLRKFGFNRNNHRIQPRKLYGDFLKYKEEFSEEQALFLECYYFKIKDRDIFKKEYPNSSLYYRYEYLVNRLEMLHYGIYKILENNFNKDKYLIVKEKYGNRFTPEKLAVLDLYYGVGGRRYTVKEITQMYGYNYLRGHDLLSDARESCINLYSNRGNRLEIDKQLYIPYLDKKYEYTEETRSILYMYLVLEDSYDVISSKTGLTKYRISNIITDGIRKIDGYRFGLFQPLDINEFDLNGVFQLYENSFNELDKCILRDKFLNNIENRDIAIKYQEHISKDNSSLDSIKKVLLEVNRVISKFYKLLFKYRINNVQIDEEDIRREINRHVSESILNEKEKLVLSYIFGIPYLGNEKGEELPIASVAKRLNVTLNVCRHNYYAGLDNIKGRKIGILKPDLCFISRDELDKILDDKNLPISDKERMIICHLFELKGYEYKSLSTIVEMLGEGSGSVRRRYYRAIVTIKKYMNGEIDAKLDYEEDIVPLLKYFSLGDRILIEDYFKNNITYEKMSQKYNMTFDRIVKIMSRIKINLFDLVDDPNTRKFDFDYYLQVRDDRNLPFYGNLPLAIQIFDLYFGMNQVERLSVPEIIKKLDLSFKTTAINNCIKHLMLAICKLRDGMFKEKEFTYDEIIDYFNGHSSEMRSTHRVYYDRYFTRMNKKRELNGIQSKVSEYITYDLLREQRDDCFKLETGTRASALSILRDNVRMPIKVDTKKSLMYYYGIRWRDIMSGKEINHVYRIMDNLIKQGILILEDKDKNKKLQKS